MSCDYRSEGVRLVVEGRAVGTVHTENTVLVDRAIIVMMSEGHRVRKCQKKYE